MLGAWQVSYAVRVTFARPSFWSQAGQREDPLKLGCLRDPDLRLCSGPGVLAGQEWPWRFWS